MFWNRASKYEIDTQANLTREKICSEERMHERFLECEIKKANIANGRYFPTTTKGQEDGS